MLGQAKSIEDTEKFARRCLPVVQEDGDGASKSYRVVYAIHEILESPTNSADVEGEKEEKPTRFIGLISLRSLGPEDYFFPEKYGLAAALDPSVLSTELGYQFLPIAWGRGFATEAVDAVLKSLVRGALFWEPYKRLYVRALVNEENPASLGVMRKLGLQNFGVWEYKGEPIFLGGKWTDTSRVFIFGRMLIDEL